MLRIHDTLSNSLQPVEPSKDNVLRFYCCGPTVYAAAHIGNFRTFAVQDVFRRVLELDGIRTKHVRNITDVDDKTIRQSQIEGRSLAEFTQEWADKFHADCEALNLLRPHIEPSAVQHIPEQIELAQKLIEKGNAYSSPDGSVYFKISSFPAYGKLSGVQDRELTTNTAARDDDEYDRDSLADFALWKGYKEEDGPNFWESPWGKGRPGWHLECSAMSMKYLGESFDLHSGGIDLVFPHHENEIAQSEAATGKTFARLWFHVVHLMVDGGKMSKSRGNMYTLDDLVAKGARPEEVRYVLIAGQYRKHLNFTFDTLRAARTNLQRLAKLEEKLRIAAGSPKPPSYAQLCKRENSEATLGLFGQAYASMLDNLNVPKALGEVFSAAGKLEKQSGLSEDDAHLNWTGLHVILEAMGLKLPPVEKAEAPSEVVALAEKRLTARAEKDWAASDTLRDEIAALGWVVKDSKGGFDLEPKG